MIDQASKMYHSSPAKKAKTIDRAKIRYHNIPFVKQQTKQHSKNAKHKQKQLLSKTDKMIEAFKKACKLAPDYVCCSCFRMRYRKQVKLCYPDKYGNANVAAVFILRKYLHVCDDSCPADCWMGKGARGSLYICDTCGSHLKCGNFALTNT